jgi:carbon monoxide dehydrogenase subunit G
MVKYEATIRSIHPADKVFDYLADFATSQEWDPGVLQASRVSDEPLEVGTSFQIVSKFLWARVPLRYEIVEIEPSRKIVLHAKGGSFSAEDTISIAEIGSETEVHYRAILTFWGPAKALAPLMQIIFNGVGRKATKGLWNVLNKPDLGERRQDADDV